MNAPPGFLEFLLCIPWCKLSELYSRGGNGSGGSSGAANGSSGAANGSSGGGGVDELLQHLQVCVRVWWHAGSMLLLAAEWLQHI